ncbi:MAG: hypothetical protein AABY01_03295 [Nanoarchaeota archaeon]
MRDYRKTRYLFAGLITIAIFALGLMLGFVVEGKRVTTVQTLFDTQRTEFASSQLQYSYVSSLNSQEACPAIYTIFFNNIKNLDETAHRLESYVKDSKLNDENFAVLKREYTIEQLRYWLLSKQARDLCNQDVVRVLYFFSTDDQCTTCTEQAFVLDYLKKSFGERLLIFSLDATFEQEPMIGILKQQYNITAYPTLIIENTPFSGFSSREDLQANICSLYRDPPEACV